MPASLLSAGIVSDLNLCGMYAVSLREFTCLSGLLELEVLFPGSHPPPLARKIFPLPHRSLILKGRALVKTSHLG